MDYNKLPKLPERLENSNKGTFGKILNVSGSEYMTGAAYLSSVSALKIGAGYVELASHDNALKVTASLAPEIVLAPINKISKIIRNSTVLLIGCGLSTTNEAVNLFKNTISLAKNLPTVIDADGLNILSKNDIELPTNTILTPHPKEASRLLHCSLDEILSDMEKSAKKISEKYNCVTVLKSHRTIVVSPDSKSYKNTTGNNSMAKAGSGDVLAGMISGLAAQGMDLFEAAFSGVYLHGLCGDFAKEKLTEYSVMAEDLISFIPNAINYLKSDIILFK